MTLNEMRQDDGTLPTYAWPGGYPILYQTRDGMTVCPKCANRETDESQAPVSGDVYWEGEPFQCEDCGAFVDSAYGTPDEPITHTSWGDEAAYLERNA